MKVKISSVVTNVPDGEYLVITEEIKEGRNYDRKVLTFVFRIAEGEFRDAIVKGFVNASYGVFSTNTKLCQWYSNLVGIELEAGTELDIELDDFKDRLILARVERKKSHKTKNHFGNVTDILRTVRKL